MKNSTRVILAWVLVSTIPGCAFRPAYVPDAAERQKAAAAAGKIVTVPCPDQFKIAATGCFPVGVTPTDYDGRKALEDLHANFQCDAPCEKVVTLQSKKNSGLHCGNTGELMWEFTGTLECQ